MKKILLLVLCIALTFTTFYCKGKNGGSQNTQSSGQQDSTEQTQSSQPQQQEQAASGEVSEIQTIDAISSQGDSAVGKTFIAKLQNKMVIKDFTTDPVSYWLKGLDNNGKSVLLLISKEMKSKVLELPIEGMVKLKFKITEVGEKIKGNLLQIVN